MWLTDLLQHGLLTPSFVPDQSQQDLCDLTRLRLHLLQDRTLLVNRIHKVLQQAGIKLAGVLSNILGASGRAIVQAQCAGESDPERLASLVHRSIAQKHEQLVEALTGDLREHHRFLLRELLTLLEALSSLTYLVARLDIPLCHSRSRQAHDPLEDHWLDWHSRPESL